MPSPIFTLHSHHLIPNPPFHPIFKLHLLFQSR
jgi:hypothetical protein